jgi:triacylglycerol lipase
MNIIKYFLLVISILVILFLIIKAVNIYSNSKNSIDGSWFNTKYCGMKKCLPTQNQLVENKPDHINFIMWDTLLAKYCSVIIYSIEKAAQDSIKPVYPKDLVMQKELYDNSEDPVFGVVFTQGENIWISFRGTLSSQEWAQDFNYQQESIEQVPLNFLNTKSGKVANVHKGFMDVYMNFRDDLTLTLKKINPTKNMKIIISGHSLGAAVATITGADLSQSGYNVGVYNFASPRVGDQTFADFIDNELKLPVYRVVNISDIVPNMPPSVSPNFKDPNNPFMYVHCGKIVYFQQNRLSVLNNHLIPVYMSGLDEFH